MGWMEAGLPKLGAMGTSLSLESQVTLGGADVITHTHTHTHRWDAHWPAAQGLPLVVCDLTQNKASDDNRIIRDKSQGLQTCTGPQGREEGRFPARAAPGWPIQPQLPHPSAALHAGTPDPCYLPAPQSSPSIASSGQFSPSQPQEATSQPLLQNVIIILGLCVSGAPLFTPQHKLGSSCRSSPPPPLPAPPAWGPGKPQAREAREPAAPVSTVTPEELRWDFLPPRPTSPYLPEPPLNLRRSGLPAWPMHQRRA